MTNGFVVVMAISLSTGTRRDSSSTLIGVRRPGVPGCSSEADADGGNLIVSLGDPGSDACTRVPSDAPDIEFALALG